MALKMCHDDPLAGHFGVRKTYDLLKRDYWWPEMHTACQAYVQACPVCARSKTCRAKPSGLLQPLAIPDRPWCRISMDFIVELPPSEGQTAILVVVDRFTKMAHFLPLRGVPSAEETAKVFVQHIVRLHGVPEEIVSDRGVQFTSRFWKALCGSLGIHHVMSSAYHPQTNGQTERTNQTLEQYLRCYTSASQSDWASLIPAAEFAYNNSVHSSTGQSPFYANYGFHPARLPESHRAVAVPAVQSMTDFLARNCRRLRATLSRAQDAARKQFDRKRGPVVLFSPGDRVWLSSAHLRLRCPSQKLGPRFIGPFTVKRRINDVAY